MHATQFLRGFFMFSVAIFIYCPIMYASIEKLTSNNDALTDDSYLC
jgi:hypothetical protein